MHILSSQTCTIEKVKPLNTFGIFYSKASGNPAAQRISNKRYPGISKHIQETLKIKDMSLDIGTFWS